MGIVSVAAGQKAALTCSYLVMAKKSPQGWYAVFLLAIITGSLVSGESLTNLFLTDAVQIYKDYSTFVPTHGELEAFL